MSLKDVYESFNKPGFEEWAVSRELEITPYSFNPDFVDELDYEDMETQTAWDCWKASFIGLSKLVVNGRINTGEER